MTIKTKNSESDTLEGQAKQGEEMGLAIGEPVIIDLKTGDLAKPETPTPQGELHSGKAGEAWRVLERDGYYCIQFGERPWSDCLDKLTAEQIVNAHNASLEAWNKLAASQDKERLKLAIEFAEWGWTVIANAGGGDWSKETAGWQEAAAKYRDDFHEVIRNLLPHQSPAALSKQKESLVTPLPKKEEEQ